MENNPEKEMLISSLTPGLVEAVCKLHIDHHQDLLTIKNHLQKMVVEKSSGKGYEHYFIPTSDLLDIVNPVIAKCDLTIFSLFYNDDIVTMLVHPSGGFVMSSTYLSKPQEGKTPDSAQWRASRFTILRRTMILGLLNIDDGSPDDDGNIASKNLYGASTNEILEQKGEVVVENTLKTIKEMNIKTVKPKQ